MGSGVFRRHELLRAGWTDGGLTRALRGGRLVRVGRDRYVLPGVVPPVEHIVARSGTNTALSHASAARAWGLPASDRRTHVVVPHSARRRGAPTRSVLVHQSRDWRADEIDGVAVTDVLTTVVDLLRSGDLADAVVVTDAALHRGLVTVGELAAAVERRAPGNVRARRALALADGRAESPLESQLRLLLALAGLPPEDAQHVVRESGRFVARVDLWYDGLVVEADGFEFHRERADYVADRRKGQAFERLGLRSLRFSWEDVHGVPDQTVATTRQVLTAVRTRAAA